MGSQQPTARGVVHALLDRVVVDDVRLERRSQRRACFGGITVTALETFHAEDRAVWVAAVMDDISQGGMSFLCPRLLRAETLLSIRFEMLDAHPTLKCIVRNVVFLGGEYHRIGAEFTE